MEPSRQSTVELFELEPKSSWIRSWCATTSCNSSLTAREPAAESDFVEMIVAAMPDCRLDIEDMFGAGDRAAVRLQMRGTHTGQPLLGRPATGKRPSAKAVFIYRVQSGRIAEAWQMIDGVAFFRLAGVFSR